MGVKSPAQSLSPNEAATVNEHDKAIIEEFREAMDKGDERAALRAEAKYRRIDNTAEKNIYDYGPNDPDPTVDYYFEPLNPGRSGKVRRRRPARTRPDRRRDCGLSQACPRRKRHVGPAQVQLAQAAAAHNTSDPPQPARRQAQKPHHPQPLTSKSHLPLGEG